MLPKGFRKLNTPTPTRIISHIHANVYIPNSAYGVDKSACLPITSRLSNSLKKKNGHVCFSKLCCTCLC